MLFKENKQQNSEARILSPSKFTVHRNNLTGGLIRSQSRQHWFQTINMWGWQRRLFLRGGGVEEGTEATEWLPWSQSYLRSALGPKSTSRSPLGPVTFSVSHAPLAAPWVLHQWPSPLSPHLQRLGHGLLFPLCQLPEAGTSLCCALTLPVPSTLYSPHSPWPLLTSQGTQHCWPPPLPRPQVQGIIRLLLFPVLLYLCSRPHAPKTGALHSSGLKPIAGFP